MKNQWFVALAALFFLSLAGCGDDNEGSKTNPQIEEVRNALKDCRFEKPLALGRDSLLGDDIELEGLRFSPRKLETSKISADPLVVERYLMLSEVKTRTRAKTGQLSFVIADARGGAAAEIDIPDRVGDTDSGESWSSFVAEEKTDKVVHRFYKTVFQGSAKSESRRALYAITKGRSLMALAVVLPVFTKAKFTGEQRRYCLVQAHLAP